MPPKKEEWEVRFEEYRDTLVSLGAKIKNEKALKLAFKIYGEERMPARIYQNCVEETGAVSSKTESPTPTETVKKEKKAETDTSTKPSTPPNGKKPTSLNSFEALADIRLEETAAGHVETTSPTEERKEKKTRKTQRERFEEYKSRLQEKGITINDENGLWEKFRSIRGRLDYGQIGEFVTFPERKPRGNAKNGNRSERRNDERNSQTRHDGSQEARDDKKTGAMKEHATATAINK